MIPGGRFCSQWRVKCSHKNKDKKFLYKLFFFKTKWQAKKDLWELIKHCISVSLLFQLLENYTGKSQQAYNSHFKKYPIILYRKKTPKYKFITCDLYDNAVYFLNKYNSHFLSIVVQWCCMSKWCNMYFYTISSGLESSSWIATAGGGVGGQDSTK